MAFIPFERMTVKDIDAFVTRIDDEKYLISQHLQVESRKWIYKVFKQRVIKYSGIVIRKNDSNRTDVSIMPRLFDLAFPNDPNDPNE